MWRKAKITSVKFWEHGGIIESKYDEMTPYEMFKKNHSLKTPNQ